MASGDEDPEIDEEAEDILGLADIIGIGRSEHEYLWIAKEAYNADLPGGWEIFFDEEGNHFYFDSKKQISTYTHPSIDYYRKLYKDFKRKDQEFREQQERREIAFGLREEETADKDKGRVSTAGSRTGSREDFRRASLEREDAALSLEESVVAEEKEGLAKTRLLQAYSHDPNLASKFRKDIREQESQASAILRRSLEKEEENFVRHLRVYVNQKQESVHGPLEALLHSHTAAQEAKIESATNLLTEQIEELKVQALAAVEEASKAAAAAAAAAQKSRSSADDEARQRRMKAMQAPQMKRVGQAGVVAPFVAAAEDQQDPSDADAGGANSPAGSVPAGECEKCKGRKRRVAELEAQVGELKGAAAAAKQGSEGEGLALAAKLADANKELAECKEREEALGGELAKIKALLAQAMVGELSAGQHRAHVEELADEARRLDAAPAPALQLSQPPPEQQQQAPAERDGIEEGERGPAQQSTAERVAESGLSAGMLMDIMERMEAMAGSGEGPIQAMKRQNESLMGRVEALEAEKGRWMRHAEELEADKGRELGAAATVAALREEVQRKAAHSEHMEFLAQQYSDQVQALQGQLRKLRDSVEEEEQQQQDAIDRERRMAMANAEPQASQASQALALAGPAAAAASAASRALPAKAPFAVRVRSSTILAVKRSAETLRAAVKLLRIDFQAYAEGIFLPLARELQRNTLVLSTSLSERARELRMCTASLGTAIEAQRLLGHKLSAVYAVSFHTLAYLRHPHEGEESSFREPQPRQLTMMLKPGFEGKREILESYEFEKVFGPEMDAVGVFRELTPFLTRVINWQRACIVFQGGRNSGKRGVALGAQYVDDGGRTEEVPGVMQQAVHFMAHVYQEEQTRVLKAKQQDLFDLSLFLELSEVVGDSVVHYMQAGADDGREEGGGGKSGPRGVSLFDVQNMLSTEQDPAEGDAADEEDEDGSERDQEEVEVQVEAQERESFVPRTRIENAADGEMRLAEALRKAEGRAGVRQQELERKASDKVARARRLAKAGSRNAQGELVEEGHLVLSITISKRERATEERQAGTLKVVLVGSPAEMEDTGAEMTAFKPEADHNTYTLLQFLERKYLRETNVNSELADSALSELVWDCVGGEAAVVLLTAVSPAPADFEASVRDLRFASTATRARPSTASRLERVKYRWQNQSVVWAFTLWKGAMMDSERIQLSNQLSNQKEENEELRLQTRELQEKLEEMATKGIQYVSAGESEPGSEDEFEAGRDELYQQKLAIQRIVTRDLSRIEEKSSGALLQAMTARLGFTKGKAKNLAASNRALSKLLAQERALAAERPTKMPKLAKLRTAARSATPRSGMGNTSLSAARRDARGGALPPAAATQLSFSASSAHEARVQR